MKSISILGLMLCLTIYASARTTHAQTVDYTVKQDIVYGHKDGMALTFDVFEPKSDAKGVGLIFMVSGGWVSAWAPPEKAVALFNPFLKAGYTVMTVRHGSSPRYVIPEIAVDVRSALKHIYEHADELKVDPQRLGVFGFSAGGHLSLLLGTRPNADKPNGEQKSLAHVAAVAAVFPPTDLAPYVDPANPLRETFPALKFEPAKAADYSPLMQVSADDPPTLLVHGDKDELVPIWHSEKLVAALGEVKVPHKLIVIPGAAHGFNAEGNQKMFTNMLAWFDEHLANPKN
ncbi:MAG: alpha/beta hydrolase [Pirellulaceae bacterium]|nr:alpha/beta hydrolase [Pirellulaceae bacterium]